MRVEEGGRVGLRCETPWKVVVVIWLEVVGLDGTMFC